MTEKTIPYGNQSLARGFLLLEILSDYPNGCSLARLSELVELNKSTTHRILQGLSALGYVTHAVTPGSYRLTAKLVAIGQKALSSLNIVQMAVPFLETLNWETGETVNMGNLENDHVILVYKLEPTRDIMRTHAYIGQQRPLHCTAMGKLFLAYSPDSYLERYWASARIERLTDTTITDIDAMRHELADIRARGLSFDREENELGVSCVAAPIFDIHQRVQYAVSSSLPTPRLHSVGEASLIPPLLHAAHAISAELGGSLQTAPV
jgi:DNA-binding IclR family transcriptional regulator